LSQQKRAGSSGTVCRRHKLTYLWQFRRVVPYECPLIRAGHAKAALPLAFRVSDAGRRRKVVDARTRGPRSVCYGDFDFARRCQRIDAAHMRTDLRADRPLFGRRCGFANADVPHLGVRCLLFGRLGADLGDPRSAVAAEFVGIKPRRVMAPVSWVMLRDMVGHAVGSGVRRSR